MIAYKEVIELNKEPITMRLNLVRYLEEIKNVCVVAKEFKSTRKTVRKWVKRYL